MFSPSLLEPHVAAALRPTRRFVPARAAHTPDDLAAPITLRAADRDDAAAVARLAALDGASPPAGELVLAEAGGRLLAAAEVATGRTIADPFEPTASIASLVRLRAEQLRPRAA